MAPFPPLTRRTLLGALGLSTLVSACGPAEERPAAGSDPREGDRVRYGTDHPDQYAVLGLPEDRDPRGLVALLHGGFWLAEYGADLMEPMAADLRARGFATWNVEYRRVGGGGGFPETFADVAAALDLLAEVPEVDGLAVSLVGHSAGGHLAAWAASRTAATPGGVPRTVPTRTISLSGVLDLGTAAAENLGNGAVLGLLGAAPQDAPADYRRADPAALVPAAGEFFAVHAEDDQIVPLSQSRRYVDLARSAGGSAELVTVPGDHFAVIDPTSTAWPPIAALLDD